MRTRQRWNRYDLPNAYGLGRTFGQVFHLRGPAIIQATANIATTNSSTIAAIHGLQSLMCLFL